MKIGDLVCPKKGRRTHWVGLAIDHRESEISPWDSGEAAKSIDFLIQWTCNPKGPAWWVDWSLEVVSESR